MAQESRVSRATNAAAEGHELVLVTGAAGFIGYHVSRRLLELGYAVVGVDNLNDYYDVGLKGARLAKLQPFGAFRFVRMNIADSAETQRLFADHPVRQVIHLAAQTGVRYSSVNPHAFAESNLAGFVHILEGCRGARVGHLLYASSSAVYGGSTHTPFSVRDNTDHPLSFYAATKKANELMAHSYAHLYGLHCTGLRFFTVYGPWGRPDMALFTFTKAILEGRPVPVFNNGEMSRDFTYIDDVVEAIVRLLDKPPRSERDWPGDAPDPGTSSAPYRIYNIGNHRPVPLLRFIEVIEQALGKKAEKQLLPMQPGDVLATHSDIGDLARAIGFSPDTPIKAGVERSVAWYREYYGP